MSAKTRNLGFIGAGNMAGAIIKGIKAADKAPVRRVSAYDVRPDRLRELELEYGVIPCASAAACCRTSSVVILAVKPQQMDAALKEMEAGVSPGMLVVSIAAGVTLSRLDAGLGGKLRLARVMPNTPLLVGEGMSAVAFGPDVPNEDRQFVLALFGAAGRVITVGEKLMDAVTALSGSGPAYVFEFVEALAGAGADEGLSDDDALALAIQTVAGSARMLQATGRPPAELRAMVSSPGGTTLAGLGAMEKAGFRAAVKAGVAAARRRATELAGG